MQPHFLSPPSPPEGLLKPSSEQANGRSAGAGTAHLVPQTRDHRSAPTASATVTRRARSQRQRTRARTAGRGTSVPRRARRRRQLVRGDSRTGRPERAARRSTVLAQGAMTRLRRSAACTGEG
eukprot:350013-Chlamydomonas_euryale.AAC.5